MPTTLTFGLSVFTAGDYLDECGVTRNIEVAKRRGTSGNFTKAKSFNPTNEVSIKGGGNSGLVVGVVTPSLSGISGGVLFLNKDENTQHNSDFDDFTSSIDHLPGGQSA